MVHSPLALHPKFTLFASPPNFVTAVIRWRNEKQTLYKIWGGKQGVLWEMCKWRILVRTLHLLLCCQALIPGSILMLHERLGQCSVELHHGAFGTPGRCPFWVLIVHLKPNSNAEDYDMYQAVKHRKVSCLEILLHVNTLLSFWDELFR